MLQHPGDPFLGCTISFFWLIPLEFYTRWFIPEKPAQLFLIIHPGIFRPILISSYIYIHTICIYICIISTEKNISRVGCCKVVGYDFIFFLQFCSVIYIFHEMSWNDQRTLMLNGLLACGSTLRRLKKVFPLLDLRICKLPLWQLYGMWLFVGFMVGVSAFGRVLCSDKMETRLTSAMSMAPVKLRKKIRRNKRRTNWTCRIIPWLVSGW